MLSSRLAKVCPNGSFSGYLIAHFVEHFVENGRISIKCDDEVRDEVFQFERFLGTSYAQLARS